MNNDAKSIWIRTSLQESVFISLDEYPGVEFLDCMVVLVLYFEDAPQWLHQFTVPPPVHKCSPFSISSPALVISCLFDSSLSSRYEGMISYYGLDLHFPGD